MGFGGAVSAMQTSLKNNKRSKVSAFKKMERFSDVKYKKGTIDKKASPALLKQIRENIQKENKRNSRITIIIISSILIILFILFTFAQF